MDSAATARSRDAPCSSGKVGAVQPAAARRRTTSRSTLAVTFGLSWINQSLVDLQPGKCA